jgi:DUF971 family protein
MEIRLDREARLVHITWLDGHKSAYGFEWLRWRCPCAYCAGEGGAPGALATTTSLTPEQVNLERLELVGRYAIAPQWADGHGTGIYSFESLRANCPCVACTKQRAS